MEITHFGRGIRGRKTTMSWVAMMSLGGMPLEDDVGRVFVTGIGVDIDAAEKKYSVGCHHWKDTIAVKTSEDANNSNISVL